MINKIDVGCKTNVNYKIITLEIAPIAALRLSSSYPLSNNCF